MTLDDLFTPHCVRVCVPQGRRGDLLVSLCYNPTANTITVNIIKARNLKAMDIGGTSGRESSLLLQAFLSLTLAQRSEAFIMTGSAGSHAALSPFQNI